MIFCTMLFSRELLELSMFKIRDPILERKVEAEVVRSVDLQLIAIRG
jgi:hypothetical protein